MGRGKRMKVRVPKPRRTFLEMHELAALLEAARDQDRPPAVPVPIDGASHTRDRVAVLAATGMRPHAIATELGLARSTLTFPPAPARDRQRPAVHPTPCDRRDASAQRSAGERAVRPPPPRCAVARPGGSGSRPSWARRRRSHPNGSSSRGGRRCPTTTPHTMRRTYISNTLLVDGFDVTWVMSQVGRADSKMTLDVYAQLE